MVVRIEDAEIEALAERFRAHVGAATIVEAIGLALRTALRGGEQRPPLAQRLRRAIALADAMGPSDPTFDAKPFMDDMWGEP
ncbi:type II toxin-antitoxin system VapB family antitoxin [Segnochrobactrum spirostomi]|uniref:Histidinol dehydrogenase n=1 Tax=Segnochrobactrum spirostomi TaxID=2608987 RepID=A0A6A7Y4H5_9HYPH|nr:type II toxin-antitoxin system VapB family antitoxin [Segnochrobactrum spirostomi]MQT13118.1 histidinol dehydrogenase [Segnochrobactrum spirostomi]